jgi:hypothetical protein
MDSHDPLEMANVGQRKRVAAVCSSFSGEVVATQHGDLCGAIGVAIGLGCSLANWHVSGHPSSWISAKDTVETLAMPSRRIAI